MELGWVPRGPSSVVSLRDRVVGTVLATIIAGPLGAIGGAAGGVRGAAGGLAGGLAAAIGMAAIGITGAAFLPVVLAAAAIAGIAAGGSGMENRVKRAVLAHTREQLPELRTRLTETCTTGVREVFEVAKTATLDALHAHIDGEEANIQRTVDLTQREEAERERHLSQLAANRNEIEGHKRALAGAASKARMG